MDEMNSLREAVQKWIVATMGTAPSAIRPLSGDGSTRRIFRVGDGEETAIVVANPLPPDRPRPDENDGYLAVASHLKVRGVPVPEILASDAERGYFLLEDLGDERLFEAVQRIGWDEDRLGLTALYREAIDLLARMQSNEGPAFDPSGTPNEPYTVEFVRDREARYFHDELVVGWAGMEDRWAWIESECVRLAREAVEGGASVFMHRDYQSRNLMIRGGSLVVIDFQGARLGPGLYDLAALLLDPYAGVPHAVRSELIDRYRGVTGAASGDEGAWRTRWNANGANRMMQALGAFAKLGGRMGRPGFLEYIPRGLGHLAEMLREQGHSPRLAALVDDLLRLPGRPSVSP